VSGGVGDAGNCCWARGKNGGESSTARVMAALWSLAVLPRSEYGLGLKGNRRGLLMIEDLGLGLQ
jgi:hypothetical protein